MGVFDIFFRKPPPIRDAAALADFIDGNAAFVTQKGLYEYSRVRAGHYAKVLSPEKGFQEAADQARWRAYPIGLAMVAEVADNVLHQGRDTDRDAPHRDPRDERQEAAAPFRREVAPRDVPGEPHRYSALIVGNRITSRIDGWFVSSIQRRSMPMPSPPVGGMPYSSARR